MMAWGEPLRKFTPFDPDDHPGFQELVMTTFAAADMIRHVRCENEGALKAAVSSILRAKGVSKDVFNILNELGVSSSYQTVRRGNLDPTSGSKLFD
jgi:hypothetical protein